MTQQAHKLEIYRLARKLLIEAKENLKKDGFIQLTVLLMYKDPERFIVIPEAPGIDKDQIRSASRRLITMIPPVIAALITETYSRYLPLDQYKKEMMRGGLTPPSEDPEANEGILVVVSSLEHKICLAQDFKRSLDGFTFDEVLEVPDYTDSWFDGVLYKGIHQEPLSSDNIQ